MILKALLNRHVCSKLLRSEMERQVVCFVPFQHCDNLRTQKRFASQDVSNELFSKPSQEHFGSGSGKSARLATLTWLPTKSEVSLKSTPVYLMHGLLGYKEEFSAFGQAVADRTGHEVTTFDARNHGESEHADQMDYRVTGDDVAAYMATHNVKQAIFAAHSMGAGSAISLALRRPELVKALFTIDVGSPRIPRKMQLHRFLKSLAKIPFRQDLSVEENRAAVQELLEKNEVEPFVIRQSLLPNIVKRDGKIQWRFNLPVIIRDRSRLTEPGNDIPLEGAYTGHVHTLIGDCSDYVPKEEEEFIFKNFPGAKLQRVPNAGHWVHLDQPEIFLEALVKFINEVE